MILLFSGDCRRSSSLTSSDSRLWSETANTVPNGPPLRTDSNGCPISSVGGVGNVGSGTLGRNVGGLGTAGGRHSVVCGIGGSGVIDSVGGGRNSVVCGIGGSGSIDGVGGNVSYCGGNQINPGTSLTTSVGGSTLINSSFPDLRQNQTNNSNTNNIITENNNTINTTQPSVETSFSSRAGETRRGDSGGGGRVGGGGGGQGLTRLDGDNRYLLQVRLIEFLDASTHLHKRVCP